MRLDITPVYNRGVERTVLKSIVQTVWAMWQESCHRGNVIASDEDECCVNSPRIISKIYIYSKTTTALNFDSNGRPNWDIRAAQMTVANNHKTAVQSIRLSSKFSTYRVEQTYLMPALQVDWQAPLVWCACRYQGPHNFICCWKYWDIWKLGGQHAITAFIDNLQLAWATDENDIVGNECGKLPKGSSHSFRSYGVSRRCRYNSGCPNPYWVKFNHSSRRIRMCIRVSQYSISWYSAFLHQQLHSATHLSETGTGRLVLS